jgi:hypothetical protein
MNEFDAKTNHEWVFDKLLVRDEWEYSTLDSIDVVHESSIKVHFRLVFSRFRADDSKISESNTLWVITNRDGEWKVLARSSFAS